MQSFLPRTKPARQYTNSRCLQLLDQRKSAFQLNLMYSYELLNRETRKEAKRPKNDFIRIEIEIRKWVGIKYCRVFFLNLSKFRTKKRKNNSGHSGPYSSHTTARANPRKILRDNSMAPSTPSPSPRPSPFVSNTRRSSHRCLHV